MHNKKNAPYKFTLHKVTHVEYIQPYIIIKMNIITELHASLWAFFSAPTLLPNVTQGWGLE